MSEDIVKKAKAYVMQCTKKNLAPAWGLTEIAIQYGKTLAPLYHLDTNKVLVALYLAHCVFSNERGSQIMKNHTTLSSEQARVRLTENKVSDNDSNDICEAIKLHHSKEDS